MCECRSVQQGAVVTIKKRPVLDVTRSARTGEGRGEFRARLPAVSVSQLMEGPPMFVEDPVVSVDERKEGRTLEESCAFAFSRVRIVVGEPIAAVRVVIYGHGIPLGKCGGEHRDMDGERDPVRGCFEFG